MRSHPHWPFPAALAAAFVALSGCSPLSLGTCSTNADCKSGATCDTTQSPPVCVLGPASCTPACDASHTCQDGTCVPNGPAGCTPACTAGTEQCLPDGGCEAVTQPSATVLAPAEGAFIGAHVAASADAVAPGGVSAVQFELRQDGGTVAQAAASASATHSDPNLWTGALDLSALDGGSDGQAFLYAVATLDGGVTTLSPPVQLLVDRTPPTLTMTTDGRVTIYAPGATAEVNVLLADTGSGVAGTQATLAFAGLTHAPVTATVSDAGVASFAVFLDPALAPDGGSAPVYFSVTGSDRVGNTSTLANDAKEVIRIDGAPPVGTATAGSAWHSQVEQVPVSGTLVDTGGSILGGQAGVALTTLAGAPLATATLLPDNGSTTSATWTATVDLSQQTFDAGFEGAWPVVARFTDAAGNSSSTTFNIQVDNGAPQISNILLTTPAAYGNVYNTDGGPLAFTAQISDSSSVASAAFAFQGQAPVSGTTIDGGLWRFSVPRPGGSFDDTALAFNIVAADGFAAGLSGAAAAVHRGDAGSSVLFDNSAPTILISNASDPGWYVRTLPDGGPALLEIDALVTDGTGLASGQTQLNISGGPTLAPSSVDGGSFVFFLNAAQATAGAASTLAFTVSSKDLLGNAGSVAGARHIDDSPPTLAGLSIRLADGGAGVGGSVVYPGPVPNTGHDGNHFIYNDALAIAGTANDQGAGLAVATIEFDGANTDGGPLAGQPSSIGCTSTPCDFAAQSAPNAAGNGPFNTPIIDGGLPQGPMSITLHLEDGALLPDGTPAHQSTDITNPIQVTRYLWKVSLTNVINSGGNNYDAGVVGLALHPDGDLIVTTVLNANQNAGANNVFALETQNAGATHWAWGATSNGGGGSVGMLADAPAIGEGDANSAPIYVASAGGYINALQPDGGPRWLSSQHGSSAFSATPTVFETTYSGTSTEGVLVTADGNGKKLYSVVADPTSPGSAVTNSVALPDSATGTPALWLGGAGYLGTHDGSLTSFAVANGAIAQVNTLATDAGTGGFWEALPDGNGNLLIAQVSSGNEATAVYRADPALAGAAPLASFSGIVAPPSLDETLHLFVAAGASAFDELDTTQASPTPQSLSSFGIGQAPLIGSDGHVYETFLQGYLVAFTNGVPSWSFSGHRAISPMTAMDCQGILYVGSGSTLYAFVTDDHGLAHSPWPTHRRDSRASGNADGPPYGMATASGCSP